MALASLGRVFLPGFNTLAAFSTISSTASTVGISAATHRLAWIFKVPKSGTINQLGVRTSTVTTAVACRLGLYTLDASGNPTSTQYGGSAYGTFTPTASTYHSVSLATPATATAGDDVALVFESDGGLPDMLLSLGNASSIGAGFPFFARYNGTSWTRFASPLACHARYADGTYGNLETLPAAGTFAESSLATNSAGFDEIATLVTIGVRCRAVGIWAYTSGGALEAILYEGTTARATGTLGAGPNSGPVSVNLRRIPFATPWQVEPGTSVRAALRPTTTTAIFYRTMPMGFASFGTALDAPAGLCMSTRLDQGAWLADTADTLPGIGLILDQFEDAAGGSYSLVDGGLIL